MISLLRSLPVGCGPALMLPANSSSRRRARREARAAWLAEGEADSCPAGVLSCARVAYCLDSCFFPRHLRFPYSMRFLMRSKGEACEAHTHLRTRFPRHDTLRPRDEKCYPCLRYDLSPMCRVAQSIATLHRPAPRPGLALCGVFLVNPSEGGARGQISDRTQARCDDSAAA